MISGPTTRSLPLPAGPDWTTFAPAVAPRRRPRYSTLKHPHARRPAASARRPKPMPRSLAPLRPITPALKADEHTLLCWAVIAAGAGALVTLATLALRFASAL